MEMKIFCGFGCLHLKHLPRDVLSLIAVFPLGEVLMPPAGDVLSTTGGSVSGPCIVVNIWLVCILAVVVEASVEVVGAGGWVVGCGCVVELKWWEWQSYLLALLLQPLL